jgi:hypothetical protein
MTRTNEALARAWRAAFTRERVTTALELLGASVIVAGCFTLFGLGVALLALGVALLAIGFLAGAA